MGLPGRSDGRRGIHLGGNSKRAEPPRRNQDAQFLRVASDSPRVTMPPLENSGAGTLPAGQSTLTVRLIGTGDAFGSGGRLNTCFHVAGRTVSLLLDCGASSLIGLKRLELNLDDLDIIVVTHFHGDHMGGIPFLIRESQITGRRSRPLQVVGPIGLEGRLRDGMECLFPGSSRHPHPPLEIYELGSETTHDLGPVRITILPVVHTPGTNPHGVSVTVQGRTVAYSGDTEWAASLRSLADGADLFICECYSLTATANHMDYLTLMDHRQELSCERIVLTHMNEEVLNRRSDLALPAPEDGLVLTVK